MTTKENNSTHNPGITYPFGVECSDHATNEEDIISVTNSINGVLETGKCMFMDGGP
ncbi:hypothetical protein NC651_008200 [Populus alba x Populus x berolinensis]|nr:hypothetical protein NC651_008200 [Populus alba x Populus x berolinensis]